MTNGSNDYDRLAKDLATATQRLLGAVRNAGPGDGDCTPVHTAELLAVVVDLERVRRWAAGLGETVRQLRAEEMRGVRGALEGNDRR